jgi:hypothetical protein
MPQLLDVVGSFGEVGAAGEIKWLKNILFVRAVAAAGK